MAKQTLLWTALPNGYSDDGKSLRISLLVSPRLAPDFDPHLESFPDFVDWPATLSLSRFTLHFGANHPVTISGNDFDGPTKIERRLGRFDSNVWMALFSKTTFVRGFEFRDLTKHDVLSYPAAEVDAMVRELYTKLAASAADQLPITETFFNDPDWSALLNAVARNDEEFTDGKTGLRRVRDQFAAFKNSAFGAKNLSANLARFQLFHTPASTPKTEKYNVDPKDAKARAEWLGYPRPARAKAARVSRHALSAHRILARSNDEVPRVPAREFID